jgi:hypothetical protein
VREAIVSARDAALLLPPNLERPAARTAGIAFIRCDVASRYG